MKVESEKVGLKLNIQKTKIMAYEACMCPDARDLHISACGGRRLWGDSGEER